MLEYIVTAIVGIICIIIGVFNIKGNVSMIHSYHYHRVSKENLLPFGKLVGIGMIIIGISIIIGSILSAITLLSGENIFSILGMGVIILGLISGISVAFYAMFKYNKGIF